MTAAWLRSRGCGVLLSLPTRSWLRSAGDSSVCLLGIVDNLFCAGHCSRGLGHEQAGVDSR